MNKKGEGEILVFFLFALLIIGLFSAIGNTDYKEYMDDCEKLNENDFSYNTTCSLFWIENNTYECEKINRNNLESFCQDKWDGKFASQEVDGE